MVALTGLHYISIIFGLIMGYKTVQAFLRRKFDLVDFVFWGCFWGLFILAVFFSDFVFSFIKPLGFARAMDFFLLLAIIFLFTLGYFALNAMKTLQLRTERIIEVLALKDSEGKKVGGRKK